MKQSTENYEGARRAALPYTLLMFYKLDYISIFSSTEELFASSRFCHFSSAEKILKFFFVCFLQHFWCLKEGLINEFNCLR